MEIRRIRLSNGLYAIVGVADHARLARHRWFPHQGRHTVYAARNRKTSEGPGNRNILMHREILGAKRGVEVDHADGNGLNNRRRNICIATKSQNRMNMPSKLLARGLRGVSFAKHASAARPWMAKIAIKGRQTYLGYFQTPEKAAAAYDRAAKKLYRHARINGK